MLYVFVSASTIFPRAASSPSPVEEGRGLRGSMLPHRITWVPFHRWPALPRHMPWPQSNWGSLPRFSLSLLGSRAVGNPLSRQSAGGVISGFVMRSGNPLRTHRAETEEEVFLLTVAAAAGSVPKPTCHLIYARSAEAGRDLSFNINGLTRLARATAHSHCARPA
jgi:hypothetical protein